MATELPEPGIYQAMMMYTTEQFWADHHKGGFRDAVTNALMFLLPEDDTEPEPTPDPTPEPVPEPTSPGNSGTAHEEHKPPKKPNK